MRYIWTHKTPFMCDPLSISHFHKFSPPHPLCLIILAWITKTKPPTFILNSTSYCILFKVYSLQKHIKIKNKYKYKKCECNRLYVYTCDAFTWCYIKAFAILHIIQSHSYIYASLRRNESKKSTHTYKNDK